MPVKVWKRQKNKGIDTVIIDTAGRLQIDQEMMAELAQVKDAVNPDEVLLVVDSMTGQEAANVTRSFHEEIGITGAILTKMDGDSRGGRLYLFVLFLGNPLSLLGLERRLRL